MADNITFGLDIPEVDLNKVDSGAFGNTANSTQATPNVSANDTNSASPADIPTSQSVAPVNNVVTSAQLESNVGAGVNLSPAFVAERISVDVPETASVDAQGNEKKISDIKILILSNLLIFKHCILEIITYK